MKLAVIGAAGMVGSRVVSEAITRGHEVSAYTRSGHDLSDGAASEALALSDTEAVKNVIDSHDVTVISVASRDDYAAALAAHRALIAAAPQGRFIVVGGAGALQAGSGLLLESPEFPAEYLPEASTFKEILDAYRAAEGLRWTMIAPAPMIAPGVRTGAYRSELDTPAGGFVSAEDFAVAVVDEAEKVAHPGQRFTVASTDEVAAAGN